MKKCLSILHSKTVEALI